MFDRLRQWGRGRIPLLVPQTVEIDLETILEGTTTPANTAEIELPLLSKTEASADLSLNTAFPAVTLNLTFLPTPPVHCYDLESFFLSPPSLFDFFSKLTAPRRVGKAYTQEQGTEEGSNRITQLTLFEERCKHGLRQSLCELCSEQEKRISRYRNDARGKRQRSQTVDVFNLLLAYLQPPLEPQLAQPLLFPPDRRPYPYQIQGIRFLLTHNVALLGDEMGLGKTIQAIVGLQGLFRKGQINRVLILCPRSLLGTWERELKKWAQELLVLKIRGTREERKVLWETSSNIYLTTYETLRQDTEQGIEFAHRFDGVILDEAQKIKNPEASLTRSVRRLRPIYRWALSGTPLENRIDDVVSLFNFLKPDMFRGLQYPYREQMVRERIAPYFLRRRVADVLTELPEKITEEIWLELNDEQRDEYDRVYEEGRSELSQPDASRIHVFALINRLKQICNMDPNTQSSSKLDYLMEQLEIIQAGDQKALVFSQFPQKTLREIAPRLASFHISIFDGNLADKTREEMLKRFQEETEPRVLLMSIKAGGVGITLTRANHVFHLDHWWNPAVAHQAEARAYRLGQTRTVFVHDIFTIETIEERIHDLLAQKQDLFDAVIDDLSTQDIQRELTDEDLFGLFDLKPPQGAKIKENPPHQAKGTSRVELASLTPAEFEHLIAQLYERMGFLARVTPQSRDGGIDIVARRTADVGRQHVIIQCKHSPSGTIGEPAVRELIGTWQENREATQAVLITSGRFSQGAISLATKNRIDVIDGPYLQGLLKKYSLQ